MTEINILRKEKGLSIREFADLLGLSESYIVKLLYRQRRVSLGVLYAIQSAFPDVDVSRFV